MKIHDLQQVAIVGGGLAGLTLARILQVHGVQPVVYERTALREDGAQPGALALQPESGQRALRAAKLTAVMNATLRVEGQDLRVCDKTGAALWEEVVPAYARSRAEIDSAVLRETLIDSLYPTVMRWDHQLIQVEPARAGGYALHFAHGESTHADLVLGADGHDSLVRGSVSPERPVPTGMEALQFTVSQVETEHPALASWVGPGTLVALQDGKGIMAQRHADGLSVDVTVPTVDDGPTLLNAPPAERRAMLVSHFETWASPLRDLILLSDDSMSARSLLALPQHRWAPKPDISLLGEAAHAVPLLHGGQANLALVDAVELAEALVDGDSVTAGLRAYETRLFGRVAAATDQAVQYLDMCMAADGAHRLAQWMAEQVGSVPE